MDVTFLCVKFFSSNKCMVYKAIYVQLFVSIKLLMLDFESFWRDHCSLVLCYDWHIQEDWMTTNKIEGLYWFYVLFSIYWIFMEWTVLYIYKGLKAELARCYRLPNLYHKHTIRKLFFIIIVRVDGLIIICHKFKSCQCLKAELLKVHSHK